MNLRKYEGELNSWGERLPGYCGYWRAFYSYGWEGRWFDEYGFTNTSGTLTGFTPHHQGEFFSIINTLYSRWAGGCNNEMIRNVESYHAEVTGNPDYHLLEAESNHFLYLIFICMTDEYPIRVYAYRKNILSTARKTGKVFEGSPAEWRTSNLINLQIIRKAGEGIYELYRVHDVSVFDLEPRVFRIAHGFISSNEVSAAHILQHFGLSSIEEIQNDVTGSWESRLAEYYFEIFSSEYLIGPAKLTREEAEDLICKLSGYENPSASECSIL